MLAILKMCLCSFNLLEHISTPYPLQIYVCVSQNPYDGLTEVWEESGYVVHICLKDLIIHLISSTVHAHYYTPL